MVLYLTRGDGRWLFSGHSSASQCVCANFGHHCWAWALALLLLGSVHMSSVSNMPGSQGNWAYPFHRRADIQLLCHRGNHCFVWDVFFFSAVNEKGTPRLGFPPCMCVCVSTSVWEIRMKKNHNKTVYCSKYEPTDFVYVYYLHISLSLKENR